MGFWDWFWGAPVSTADYYQQRPGEGRQATEDAGLSAGGYSMCTPARGCAPTGRQDCGRVPLNYSQPVVAHEPVIDREPRYRLPKWERPNFDEPYPKPLSQLPPPATGNGDALARGLFGGIMARRQERRYEKR